jgi:heterotetrameric sarcosine oxidase gamma subunit
MVENAAAGGPIPMARSPIPIAPPEIELAGWAVSGRRSDAAVTIADWTPIAKVLLHAPLGGPNVRDAPGVSRTLGPPSAGGGLFVRWGPDEWLALGPPGSQPALRHRFDRADGTVVDVTHAYAVVRLTGDRAADVLAHECALDLSRQRLDGSALRTAVSGVAAGLIRDDVDDTPSYLVTCEWSLGHYLYESLLDAGNKYGIEVDGLRITQSQWAIRNARER